MDTRFTYYRH